MQLTCLYHPVDEMKVLDDADEYDRLIATGFWFDHPLKAKSMRESYEKRIQSGQKSIECEQPTKQVRSRAQRKKRVCEGAGDEISQDGRQSA